MTESPERQALRASVERVRAYALNARKHAATVGGETEYDRVLIGAFDTVCDVAYSAILATPTPQDGLVAQLRQIAPDIHENFHHGYAVICREAADAIEARDREIKEIREESSLRYYDCVKANQRAETAEAKLDAQTAHVRERIRLHDELGEGYDQLALELDAAQREKDGAYLERNQVVAAFARSMLSLGWRVGIAHTAIEGWSEDWHGCVYIDTPNGQASWHYHESQSGLFSWLPSYKGKWDGHTTPEKYQRLTNYARASQEGK